MCDSSQSLGVLSNLKAVLVRITPCTHLRCLKTTLFMQGWQLSLHTMVGFLPHLLLLCGMILLWTWNSNLGAANTGTVRNPLASTCTSVSKMGFGIPIGPKGGLFNYRCFHSSGPNGGKGDSLDGGKAMPIILGLKKCGAAGNSNLPALIPNKVIY